LNPRVQLLIDELHRHRNQFEVFCRSLTDDELAAVVPNSPWTVKDYIAHLATIDGLIAYSFQAAVGRSDIPPMDVPPTEPMDIDDWNALIVPARRDKSVEELLAEAAKHREAMVGCWALLGDEQLDSTIMFGARKATGLPDVPVPLRAVLWAISVHDPNHTSDMLRAIPHKKEVPFVREWIATSHYEDIHPDITARRS
jgi:hypothetical protein